MNAKRARALRKRARELTDHLPEHKIVPVGRTARLGECQRGAYRALKTGRYRTV